jgi:hypothetical protein
MPQVAVSFVILGRGPIIDGAATNVVRREIAAVGPLAVTGTATAAGSRPQAPPVPAGENPNQLFAHVANRGSGADIGPVRVAWGANPTAAAGASPSGLWIEPGNVEVIGPLTPGWLLSFVQGA